MHRRTVLTTSVLAGLALATTSHAAVRPSRAATSTYYLHGGPTGNLAELQAVAGGGTGVLPMDATKPTSPQDSEYAYGSLGGQPDTKCVGNAQSMLPTWTGTASGTLLKKVVVTFFSRSTVGGGVIVRLFTDLPNKSLCGVAFPAVVSSASTGLSESPLAIPQTVTLLLPRPVAVKKSFTIQFVPDPTVVPAQGSSLVFDSAASPSAVTWVCQPLAGKRRC